MTKQFNGKTTADNKIVITISAGDIDFIDGTNAVILVRSTENSNANTNLQRVTDFTFSADNTNGVLTIDLDNNNFNEQPFIVTIPMNFKSDTTNQNIRSKTLEDVTVTVQRNTSSTDPNLFIFDGLEGNAVVTDLYSVTSILDGGVDVTSKFSVDDGQRVDMYDFARLILNQNETLTNDFVTVNLKKFTHTYNNGDRSPDKVIKAMQTLMNMNNHQSSMTLIPEQPLDFMMPSTLDQFDNNPRF